MTCSRWHRWDFTPGLNLQCFGKTITVFLFPCIFKALLVAELLKFTDHLFDCLMMTYSRWRCAWSKTHTYVPVRVSQKDWRQKGRQDPVSQAELIQVKPEFSCHIRENTHVTRTTILPAWIRSLIRTSRGPLVETWIKGRYQNITASFLFFFLFWLISELIQNSFGSIVTPSTFPNLLPIM